MVVKMFFTIHGPVSYTHLVPFSNGHRLSWSFPYETSLARPLLPAGPRFFRLVKPPNGPHDIRQLRSGRKMLKGSL